jgi:hypothetical protein
MERTAIAGVSDNGCMRRLLVLGVLCAACGSSSPTAPNRLSTPPMPPVSETVTLTGHLTATNGGQSLGGVDVASTGFSSTTDGSGAFAGAVLPTSFLSLTMTGSSIVPRSLNVAVMGARDFPVTAISLAGGFDLTFYRQFVRNAYETPDAMEPLRRWTTTPALYVQTIDTQGKPIGIVPANLDPMIATMVQAISEWSNGAFRSPVVQIGAETREGQAGWITVKWLAEAAEDPDACGRAQIAKDGGWIQFNPKLAGCRCPGQGPISNKILLHEVGHAMGFYHTQNATDVMNISERNGGCGLTISAKERYHAAIAYQRPVGNRDPDSDPSGAVALQSISVR